MSADDGWNFTYRNMRPRRFFVTQNLLQTFIGSHQPCGQTQNVDNPTFFAFPHPLLLLETLHGYGAGNSTVPVQHNDDVSTLSTNVFVELLLDGFDIVLDLDRLRIGTVDAGQGTDIAEIAMDVKELPLKGFDENRALKNPGNKEDGWAGMDGGYADHGVFGF